MSFNHRKSTVDNRNLGARTNDAVGRGARYLYARQRDNGSWVDRLSSSAISTALAIVALDRADPAAYRQEVEAGLGWLRRHQRQDGGWSDADADPPSSKSGTAFAISALHALDSERSDQLIKEGMGFLDAAGGVARVPGMRGAGPKTWPAAAAVMWALVGLRELHQQPYQPIEVMLLPQSLRNKVSIALPGVLGLGIMQSRLLPGGAIRRILHRLAEPRALSWLRTVQERNGGIEECPMLAALILIGLEAADVGQDIRDGCLNYLLETRRSDGSWAIDRDLEVAVTTYAVMALAECGEVATETRLRPTRDWLLSNQWDKPFRPLKLPAGGWSWAMPSGWPESDDTAAVLLALAKLGLPQSHPAAKTGVRWLISRQNRNGSWSEWVRNSSILNDRPCPAVTAQVIIGLREHGEPIRSRSPIGRAFRYLESVQETDGSFSSLWFRKFVFGTAKVLEAYAEFDRPNDPVATGARRWLLAHQRPDGAWPANVGPEEGTVEETAWAVYALLRAGQSARDTQIKRAVDWLITRQRVDGTWQPSPVGLYFDDLRYNDDLIAHTYVLRALGYWLSCSGWLQCGNNGGNIEGPSQ